MKKVMKKSISLLLAMALVFSLFAGVFSASAASFAVGDYIKFGSYNGSPILWRVIDVDKDNGVLLFSEKILTLKPFDAAEPTQALPADYPNFGNNYWESSNIRDWLNSADAEVEWSTNSPRNAYVEGGYNEYDTEPGFLYNFTEAERAQINEVELKNMIDMVSKSVAIDGNSLLAYNSSFEDCLQNYDEAYYRKATDKVFLLDLQQFHDYVYMRGFNVGKTPTEAAVVTSEYKNSNLSSGQYWKYWLRTCRSEDNTSIRTVYYDNYILDDQAYSGINGVAPALYLKPDAPVAGGNGTAANPYVIAGGKSTYSDMAGYEWAEEAVNTLTALGAVNGVGDGRFDPAAPVTRADFVLMMMRALGQTATTKSNFKDVPNDAYYYAAVGQAKLRGYVGGYEDRTFHPEENITMEDIYVILSRVIATNKNVLAYEVAGNLECFADYDQIAGYAKAPMSHLAALGVIDRNGKYVYPKATATRVDCAVAIFHMLGAL